MVNYLMTKNLHFFSLAAIFSLDSCDKVDYLTKGKMSDLLKQKWSSRSPANVQLPSLRQVLLGFYQGHH